MKNVTLQCIDEKTGQIIGDAFPFTKAECVSFSDGETLEEKINNGIGFDGDYLKLTNKPLEINGTTLYTKGNTTGDSKHSFAVGKNTKINVDNSHTEGAATFAGNYTLVEKVAITSKTANSITVKAKNEIQQSDFIFLSTGSSTQLNVTNITTEGDSTTIEFDNIELDLQQSLSHISIIREVEVEAETNPYTNPASHAEGVLTIAGGKYSHAEGNESIASGMASHAEGYTTIASGQFSHAEGNGSVAKGLNSHAEGQESKANDMCSHAEGKGTLSGGMSAHAEGYETTAIGMAAHAEGNTTTATEMGAHAEGYNTNAVAMAAHAEGQNCTASGTGSHAEGMQTNAASMATHAEGMGTVASANCAHAEGQSTQAIGMFSHAEGNESIAEGFCSHAAGQESKATKNFCYAQGYKAEATGFSSHAEGYETKATGMYAHAESNSTNATGMSSHAEGQETIASGNYSHAEGYKTQARESGAHAEGSTTQATGMYAHAEGYGTLASKPSSHAEGYQTQATGMYAHAEGNTTTASGYNAHAEGQDTQALERCTHAEGCGTMACAPNAHAEGENTVASGPNSHAAGIGTLAAQNAQFVAGKYNTQDVTGSSLFIIGNGVSQAVRSNALAVQTLGNIVAQGAYSNNGSNYAEMFEWNDSNETSEDRVGYFVTFETGTNKIRKANADDAYVLGIITSDSTVIGNNYDAGWNEPYVKDTFGRIVYTTAAVIAGEEAESTVEPKAIKTPQINSNYNSSKVFIPRNEQAKWGQVGIMGKIWIRHDGTCNVGDFCKSNAEGIATKADAGTGYYVLEKKEDAIRVMFK